MKGVRHIALFPLWHRARGFERCASMARWGQAGHVGREQVMAFSLLELVIALAVSAAIAAYAIPSYREYIARGHRRDAIAALYRAAHVLEGEGLDFSRPGTGRLPAGFEQAPAAGDAVYRLQVRPGDPGNGGYAIEARPVENGPMAGDACGTFAIDALGRRTNLLNGAVASDARTNCWLGR